MPPKNSAIYILSFTQSKPQRSENEINLPQLSGCLVTANETAFHLYTDKEDQHFCERQATILTPAAFYTTQATVHVSITLN